LKRITGNLLPVFIMPEPKVDPRVIPRVGAAKKKVFICFAINGGHYC
jgi:hypothetical protein